MTSETTTHNYRGYSFTVGEKYATIQTRNGSEIMSIADVLRYIDAAWNKFDRSIVEEALAVAVNEWEYEGKHEKAKAAADIINGSRADNTDFLAGASYVVDYVENELGIDLGDTGLAEYRDLNA